MCKQYDLRTKNKLPVLREIQDYGNQEVCLCPTDMIELINQIFEYETLPEEHIWAIGFNVRLKPLGIFEISHGTSESSAITPKELFVRLILCGASRFVLVHNHPSGDAEPSEEDIKLTERIQKCGELMTIHLIDHLIVGDKCYYSFEEAGRL